MKNKKERVYLGQGLTLLLCLSRHLQAILLNPGIDQGSLYNAFPSPEMRWARAREKTREKVHDGRAFPMAPALPEHFPRQVLLLPQRKRGR